MNGIRVSIARRLAVAFAVIILVTIAIGLVGVYDSRYLADITDRLYAHPLTVSQALLRIRSVVDDTEQRLEYLISADDTTYIEDAIADLQRENQLALVSFYTLRERFLGDVTLIIEFQRDFVILSHIVDHIIEDKLAGREAAARETFDAAARAQILEVKAHIPYLVDFAADRAAEFHTDAIRTYHVTRNQFIALLSFAVLVCVVIALTITRTIRLPLRALVSSTYDISQGTLDNTIETQRTDEFGVLSAAMQELQVNLREKARIAERVAEEDFSATIVPKNDRDILAHSINRIVNNFTTLREERDRENWIRDGRNELAELSRRSETIDELADGAISFLCRYIDGHMGLLYVFDEEQNDLELVGKYAVPGDTTLPQRVEVGGGLVGQSVVEGHALVLSDVPESFYPIQSALGTAAAQHALAVPLYHNGELKAVVEVASLHRLSDNTTAFLDSITESLAALIHILQSKEKVEFLLSEAQSYNERLEAQQEELHLINQDLAQQTKALRESESNLQRGQEELRVANEELEVRTQELREQRDLISEKNIDLERAWREVDEKARALETTNQYKSEFLANMSHELRTPLNSIIVLAQLMAESADLHPKEREYADTIHSAGDDLLTLINDILDLSKIEAGKMEMRVDEVGIVDVCLAMEQMFDHVAEKKDVAFRIDRRDDLPEAILTDPLRLKQILQNLLSNAFKFTEAGEVTLTVRNVMRSGTREIRAVEFVVDDTGIGIPADKQELVFEAFQQGDGTTNRRYGGTGLGLSISRQLAAALGGRISFSSLEGEGSSFSLTIPVAHEVPPGEAEPRPPAHDRAPTPKVGERSSEDARDDRHTLGPDDTSLLIIASDTVFAQLVAQEARTRGFKTLHAPDGETGLHFADYYRPSAVILDVDLPGIDGWEVTERLQKNRFTEHIPIHIIAEKTETPATIPSGAIGHIPKPVTVESLQRSFQRIEKVLDTSVKYVLILEADHAQHDAIRDLIEGRDVKTTTAETTDEAFAILKSESIDCAILDLDLKEGLDLLKRVREDESVDTPVIVYTGDELTRDDEARLSRYAESIIVKGARSQDRLLDETMLFLHRVERRPPSERLQRQEQVPHEEEPVLRDKTILIVDDDMRNVFALTSVLEDKGVHVVAARNGREAVEKIQSMERVDGVLMDIMMPEMDGYEATQRIREHERFRKLPIIALTAKAMRGDRQKCIDAGATDYLSKPVDVAKLLSLLRVWLYR